MVLQERKLKTDFTTCQYCRVPSSPDEVQWRACLVNLLTGSPKIIGRFAQYTWQIRSVTSESQLKPQNIAFRWKTEILYCV